MTENTPESADSVIRRIEQEMAAACVPADQWDTVRRALIVSLHPAPLGLTEGPAIAADMILALSALDGETAQDPGTAAVREGTRSWLTHNGALTNEENTQ